MPDKASATQAATHIDSILQERRKFECPEHFRQQAHIKSLEEYERIYRESVEQPEQFWGRIAEELHWFKKWDNVLDWIVPGASCFGGARIIFYSTCSDGHGQTGAKIKPASAG